VVLPERPERSGVVPENREGGGELPFRALQVNRSFFRGEYLVSLAIWCRRGEIVEDGLWPPAVCRPSGPVAISQMRGPLRGKSNDCKSSCQLENSYLRGRSQRGARLLARSSGPKPRPLKNGFCTRSRQVAPTDTQRSLILGETGNPARSWLARANSRTAVAGAKRPL